MSVLALGRLRPGEESRCVCRLGLCHLGEGLSILEEALSAVGALPIEFEDDLSRDAGSDSGELAASEVARLVFDFAVPAAREFAECEVAHRGCWEKVLGGESVMVVEDAKCVGELRM